MTEHDRDNVKDKPALEGHLVEPTPTDRGSVTTGHLVWRPGNTFAGM